MTSGIYCIRNTISGKRYVGSAISVSHRWHNHKSDLEKGKHHSPHLQHAWKQYGADVFEWTVVEVCSPEMLMIREQAWIDYYQSYVQEHGYNICPKAYSSLGIKRSEGAKKKMADAHRGRILSEETKLKMSLAHRGRTMTEEAKKKLSFSRKGKLSPETRLRMSEANRRRPTISDETRKKYSDVQLGKHHSEETKKKMSESQKLRKDRVLASSGRQSEKSQVG